MPRQLGLREVQKTFFGDCASRVRHEGTFETGAGPCATFPTVRLKANRAGQWYQARRPKLWE